MSSISDRFAFNTAEDAFWFVGLIIGSCLTCLTICIWSVIVQHLHCLPQLIIINDARKQIEPPHTTLYATLSASFAALCVILIYTTYPVCTQFQCGYNILGNFYYNFILDTYIFSKLFLYFLFIGRLFNIHYQQIYKYPNWIKHFLFSVITIVFVTTIVSNIGSFYNFHYQNLNAMIIISICVYTLADFILSGCTLVLFFRPLWNQHMMNSSTESMSIVLKYGVISALQTLTAMLYGISLIIRFIFGWFHTSSSQGNSYLDICSLIQMMDMFMTMLCIHLGFAKKHTYKQYCKLCERYWVICCLTCCAGYELAFIHDEENWNKNLLSKENRTISAANPTIQDTATNPMIQRRETNQSSTMSIDCAINVVYDAAENAKMEDETIGMLTGSYETHDEL